MDLWVVLLFVSECRKHQLLLLEILVGMGLLIMVNSVTMGIRLGVRRIVKLRPGLNVLDCGLFVIGRIQYVAMVSLK